MSNDIDVDDETRQTLVELPRLCHEPHASGLTCCMLVGTCNQEGEILHTAMHNEVQVAWSNHRGPLEVVNEAEVDLGWRISFGEKGHLFRHNNSIFMAWDVNAFAMEVA